MNLKSKIVAIAALLLVSAAGYSQFTNFSNRGKEFWVGYGHHQYMVQPPYANDQEMVIYLSTQQDPAVVTVQIDKSGTAAPPPAGGPWTRTYTIPAYTVVSIEDPLPAGVTVTKSPTCIQAIGTIPKGRATDCGFDARLVDVAPSLGGTYGEKIFQKKGIHITSTAPIVAYAHIYGSANSGATMLMPVETWGYNYTSLNSMQRNADNAYSWMFVVAKSDHTKIEITPSVTSVLGKPAGVPFQIRLNRGEIYQLIGALTGPQDGLELTGTTIKSIANDSGQCFPVAVFSGSSRTGGEPGPGGTPTCTGGRDNDIQQCFPQEAWGKRYLTAPMSASTNPSTFMNNVYKIVVADPTTVIKRNGVVMGGYNAVSKSYKFQSQTADYIEADKPVMIAQYMGGDGSANCNPGSGDPEMIYISPVEQAINQVGFYRNTQENITVNYLTLIIPTAGVASLRIDGVLFNSIATNKYSYVHPNRPGYTVCVRKWNATKAQSFAASDSSFTAITYGEGGVESYGYNAGTYIFNLNALTTIHNVLDTAHPENNFTCTQTKVDLCQWIAYVPTQIIWNLNGLPLQPMPPGGYVTLGDGINPIPFSDSIVIDGKKFYKFCIPGNPFTFTQTGTFSIPDSVKNPGLSICNPWEKFTMDVIVKQKPLASFTYDPVTCASDSVHFHGAPSGNGYTLSQWFWEFMPGVPHPDSSQHPSYLFPNPATTYPVKLSVASSEGCYADTILNVVIPPNDTTSFTVSDTSICAGSTITITPGPTATTMWYWDFGDGVVDSFTNGNPFTHTYANPGVYIIHHSIKGSGTCKPTAVDTITVYANPVTSFTISPTGCLPPTGTVNFTGVVTISDGQSVGSYSWDFGDPPSGANNTSTLQNPSHNYSNGTYSVTFSATTANGCFGDTIQSITLDITPVVQYPFPPTSVCRNTAPFSVDSGRITNGPIPGSGVYSGPGTSPAGIFDPSLANIGSNTIWYTYTSAAGCKDSASITITVNDLPVSSFTYPTGCLNNLNITFTATSTIPTGNTATYTWDFGDPASGAANIGTGISPTHTYPSSGPWNIKIVTTTNFGCSDSTTVAATFNVKPTVVYPALPGICGNAAPVSVATATPVNGSGGTGVYSGPGTDAAGNFDPVLAGPGTHTIKYVFTTTAGCSDSATSTITVSAKPVAGFTNPTGCLTNGNLQFTDTSKIPAGFTATYTWNFGDPGSGAANTSSVQNPTHNYTAEGTYPVKLIIDLGGCMDSTTVTVNVRIKPQLNYPALAAVCANVAPYSIATGVVTNGITGTPKYSGPGTDSAGTFDPATAGVGSHTIWFIFTTTGGCVDSVSQTITVNNVPFASFSFPTACLPNGTVQFTNNSTGATSYTWDFGDGSPINNTTSPSHPYSSSGPWNVTLTAISSICSNDTTISVLVRIKPILNYPALTAVCANSSPVSVATGAVTNGVTGTPKYRGPGTDSAGTFDPAVAGVGTHTIWYIFTSSLGCADSVSQTITVNAVPVASFSFPTACLPNGNVQFVNNSTGATSYVWNFGDASPTSTQTAPSHPYASSGPFNVLLTATAGICSDDTTISVTVRIKPILNYPALTAVCANSSPVSVATGTVTNGVTGTPKYRGPGTDSAGTFNPAVAGVGTHTIWYIFTSSLGCADSVSQTITVNTVPVASFSFPTSCLANGNVQFVNNSTGATSYLWNFGDGSPTSIQTAPSHPYSSSGPFNVKLTATAGICSHDTTIAVTVRIQPTLNFPALSTVCANTAPFSIANGTVTNGVTGTPKYRGPGTDSAGTFNPAIAGVGTHTIWYIFTSTLGCSDSIPRTITVSVVPHASFTFPSGCLSNTTMPFTGNSTNATNYSWTFGDGGTSNAASPSHTYGASGIYTVKLIATAGVCSDDTIISVPVRVKPVLTFGTLPGVCMSSDTVLVNKAALTNGAVVTGNGIYKGPGVVDTLGKFIPSIAGAGTHKIWYVYTTLLGCIDSVSQNIQVYPKPVAGFNLSSANICLNSSVTLTNTSSVTSGSITKYYWDYGDGDGDTLTNNSPVVKSYSAFGTYNIRLIVVSNNNCVSDPENKQIDVRALPVADFDLPANGGVCMPNGSAQFTNTSTIQGEDPSTLTYTWNFGDGTPTSTAVDPVHIYNSLATGADVTLLVTSAYNCVSDTMKRIAFFSKPIANFIVKPDTVCQGTPNTFTDLSVAPNSSIATRHWSFGDGTSADTIINPVKTYNRDGTFKVRLTVTNTQGCSADTFKIIKVYLQPIVDAGLPLLVPQGQTITLNPTVNSSNLTFEWSPATGLNSPYLLHASFTATDDITYRLTATGEGGCFASDTVHISVMRPINIPNSFSPNGDGVNDKWRLTHIEDYPYSSVEVFNRYGQKVFSAYGGNGAQWDGTNKGKPLPVGTYYYIINLKDKVGATPYAGYVVILR